MVSRATPLLALEAVAIDTETTGLDPRHAWIVELGAVRLIEGRLASLFVLSPGAAACTDPGQCNRHSRH